MFKKVVKRLVRLGVLEEDNDSEWGAPYFAQPKVKTNRFRFLSDFQNLNRQLKRKPYPMPKKREMLTNLEVFQYTTSLDLNMGHYHIRLIMEDSNLCTIIILWKKYRYTRLPMGVRKAPDVFWEKINEMFCGFGVIREYIDDFLTITKGGWYNNLEKL